ncbi:MAG: DUF5011 domain-containing protein [Bacteroidetes bacterium]|nr:MAG: DUF5011 domain-containing protein [Bacteroidota bacterium]
MKFISYLKSKGLSTFKLMVAGGLMTVPFAASAQYTSSDAIQNTLEVFPGMNNTAILEVQVVTGGNASVLTAMTFSTSGTTSAADIENAKLIYDNNGSFNASLSLANQVGSTVTSPNGNFTFTGLNIGLASGTNRFFLVYDLPYSADTNNVVDAECLSVVVDANTETPSNTAPTGDRAIVGNAFFNYCLYPATNPLNYQIGISRLQIGTRVITNAIAVAGTVQTNTTDIIDLVKDVTYDFNYNGGSGNPQNERIYIDLNNDGFFDASEIVFSGSTPASTRTYGSLPVDCGLESGLHRVRIATDLGVPTSACGPNGYGTAYEITVNFMDAPAPVADFTVNDTVYTGSYVDFTNTSSGLGYTYSWDFENDGNVDANTTNARTQYNTAGSRTVKLKMERISCGSPLADSITKTVVVQNPTGVPSSEFIANRNITNQTLIVTLTDLSTNGANKWHWKITPEYVNGQQAYIYANGTDSTSQNPEILFSELGEYNVEFYSENILGAGNYVTKPTYIRNIDVINFCSINGTTAEAGFIADEGGVFANYPNYAGTGKLCGFLIQPACAADITFNFLDFDMSSYQVTGCFIPGSNPQTLQPFDHVKIYDGTDNTGIPLHVAAGFPNGFSNGPANTPLAQLPPSVTASSGSMFIEYSVNCAFNGRGFLGEWSSTPKVLPTPMASFTGVDSAYINSPEIFTNTTSGIYDQSSWDFNNDGLNDYSGIDAEITFTTPGTQTVKLTASRCGNGNSFTKDVVVRAPSSAPVVDFTASRTEIIVLDTVRFSDKSLEGPTQWRWTITPSQNAQFVDGTTSTSRNPRVQFTRTGSYTVKLWALNNLGQDSLTKTTYVNVFAYCTPSAVNLSADIGISEVNFGGINRTSNTGVTGYTSYMDWTEVQVGATYPITISRPSSYNQVNYKVWIDFNKNGTFNDPGEEVASSGTIAGLSFNASIRIPKNATEGTTRMRIGASSESNPNFSCGPNQFGEFEDYRIFITEDNTKPVITLNGSNPFYIEQGYSFTDPGAVAWDNGDGDISQFILTNSNFDSSVVGEYFVSYNVTDSAGNKADSVTRYIIVEEDGSGPHITLQGGDTIFHPVNTTWNEPGYSAIDFVDGVINNVTTVGTVDDAQLGVYFITYNALDLQGNSSSVQRVVKVVDQIAPLLALNGADPLIVNFGDAFPDPGVSITDNYYTSLAYQVSGSVNTKVLGNYILTYTSVDPSGNAAAPLTRTVIVQDTEEPSIDLIGLDTLYLDVFTKYVESGAVVTDNHTKGLTYTITGSVNNAALGEYVLTYNATDSSGNAGSVARVVRVVDREAPVITLKGSSLINMKRFGSLNDPGVTLSDNYDTEVELQANLIVVDSVVYHQEGVYQYCYRLTDNSGNKAAEVCRIVQVGPADPNGIETAELEINVFPNPSRNVFNIDLSGLNGLQSMKVYNIQGSLVQEIAIESGKTLYSLDLGEKSPGIYYVTLNINNTYHSVKLLLLD